jgi:hypothetical protein
MKLELRHTEENGRRRVRGLVCIAESAAESRMLDQVFGSKVNADDTVGIRRIAEARLSDGYGQHYVYIDVLTAAIKP